MGFGFGLDVLYRIFVCSLRMDFWLEKGRKGFYFYDNENFVVKVWNFYVLYWDVDLNIEWLVVCLNGVRFSLIIMCIFVL